MAHRFWTIDAEPGFLRSAHKERKGRIKRAGWRRHVFRRWPVHFTVDVGTLITATVPVAATDGPIAVTRPTGTDASLLSFDVTPSPVPTILAFLP